MRRIANKILLPLLCVVALCLSTFGMLNIFADDTEVSQAILDKYDKDTWNGMKQVGKAGDGIVTAWDILKVDGYIEGVWIPWLTHSWLGSSLAANDLESYDTYVLADGTIKDYWQNMNEVGLDKYNNTQLEMEIFNLRALGFNMLAYAGAPWAEGRVNNTDTWYTEGVKEEYLTNIRRFLDMPGRNQYSSGSNPSTDVESSLATGPLMAGEYGMSGSAGQFTEAVWSSTMIEKRENYLADGYSGFFQWAYEPVFTSDGTLKPNGNQMIAPGGKNPYDLRQGCYEACYWAVAKQGGNVNAPIALYYCGSDVNLVNGKGTYSGKGKVYWIKPKNGASVTVERSVNGGAWTKVTGTTSIDSTTGSYRYCMTDSSAPSSGTVQYRVSANGVYSYTNVWDYSHVYANG